MNERAPLPLWWTCAIVAISAAWAVLQIPYGFGLQPFAYFDAGWALSTNDLLSEGLVPTQDFAYFYGLLTLTVDRIWFGLFGATPMAQGMLCLVCAVASTHAVIRFARAAQLQRPALWLLLVCSPLAIMPGFYPSPTHALEHALLISALACQASGRRATALALATVCLFVKPTLAACYGPILVAVILFGVRPTPASWTKRLCELVPAAIVGLAIGTLLTMQFGLEPLWATLLPIDGARFYASQNFGFFGAGRQFWWPEPFNALFYFLNPAPLFLVGSLVLALGTFRTARRGREADSTLITCALLHFAFVFFLFGNEMSWKYYPYLLVFGLCSVVNGPLEKPLLTKLLIALALTGQSLFTLICAIMFFGGQLSSGPIRNEATVGLMASGEDQKSWAHVREIAANDRVLVLVPVSACRVMMPELDSPKCWYLLKPIARPAEFDRVNAQIRAANWLVIPTGPGERLDTWPEFADSIAPFRVVETHSTFLLARRMEPRAMKR